MRLEFKLRIKHTDVFERASTPILKARWSASWDDGDSSLPVKLFVAALKRTRPTNLLKLLQYDYYT